MAEALHDIPEYGIARQLKGPRKSNGSVDTQLNAPAPRNARKGPLGGHKPTSGATTHAAGRREGSLRKTRDQRT
jgi:hypothetical protein